MQVRPVALRTIHAILILIWLALLFPTIRWWKDSILWVASMSIWSNVAGHFAAYQGARAEDMNTNTSESEDQLEILYKKIMGMK